MPGSVLPEQASCARSGPWNKRCPHSQSPPPGSVGSKCNVISILASAPRAFLSMT